MAEDNRRRACPDDPRVYFAAERTLLAWVRTGLAMMGFGFVVARFGLFLRELGAAQGVVPQHQLRLSLWIGVMLIILGVVAQAYAANKHWQTIARLDTGEPLRFQRLSPGVVIALLLALLGVAVAIYLLLGLEPPG